MRDIIRNSLTSRTQLQTAELNRQNARFIEDTVITVRDMISRLEGVLQDLETAQNNSDRIADLQSKCIERQA